jgi:hypothetical protein
MPPSSKRNRNDRLRIDQYAFDLCGITAIGKICSCGGGLSFISSHATIQAWLVFTFSNASAAKCSMAPGVNADWWGPWATAAHISSFIHGCPICVGHPKVAHWLSSSTAGWLSAHPDRHIEFQYPESLVVIGCSGVLSTMDPWVDHNCTSCSCNFCSWHCRLFSHHMVFHSLPFTAAPSLLLGAYSPLCPSASPDSM